jgi:hypothetical protein
MLVGHDDVAVTGGAEDPTHYAPHHTRRSRGEGEGGPPLTHWKSSGGLALRAARPLFTAFHPFSDRFHAVVGAPADMGTWDAAGDIGPVIDGPHCDPEKLGHFVAREPFAEFFRGPSREQLRLLIP